MKAGSTEPDVLLPGSCEPAHDVIDAVRHQPVVAPQPSQTPRRPHNSSFLKRNASPDEIASMVCYRCCYLYTPSRIADESPRACRWRNHPHLLLITDAHSAA